MESLGQQRFSRQKVIAANGFSLVEILTVVALLTILIALVSPVIRSVADGYALSDAGQRLAAQIERARIHATTTQNVTLLRFFPDPEDPDLQKGVKIFRLYEVVPSSASPLDPPVTNAIARAVRLTEPVFLSWEKSSALRNAGVVPGTAQTPGSGILPCVEFYFFPDGSTSLEAQSPNPYFTMLSKKDLEYIRNPHVVSLDPLTARITIFRR